MRRYIDYAILWDFLFAILIGSCLFLNKSILKDLFTLPKIENLFSFGISLITVSATLLGFLLTITTVIVTFKKGFDDRLDNNPKDEELSAKIPERTIFEKHISKESKFYGTQIHKKVVDVFVNSTFEIGVILLVLLILQFNVIGASIFTIAIISFCMFIVLLLSIIRCLFIFKLFLNVHIHESKLDKFK